MDDRQALWELVAEGLDLCVRARKLDQMVLEQNMEKLGWTGTRSGTPHLWAMEQYDTDLKAWEDKAKKHLLSHPFA